MLYIPSMAVSIATGADDSMLAHLAQTALEIALRLRGQSMPRMTFCNLNAPALPPDQVGPPLTASLSDSYYIDQYEKRINPRGVSYFWLQAGEDMEPPQPGTDLWLLGQGHMTLTFVGGFVDHNGLFDVLSAH